MGRRRDQIGYILPYDPAVSEEKEMSKNGLGVPAVAKDNKF